MLLHESSLNISANFNEKIKGKVDLTAGNKCAEMEQKYSSTLSLTSKLDGC
jgi:hypothetical protein